MIIVDPASSIKVPFTIEEIAEAIDYLKLNKSPGLDGLTAEFYKKFKDILLSHLQQLIAGCLEEKKIPPIWTQAKLVLLPKSD